MYEIELSGSHETGVCECCGNESRRVWGYVHRQGRPIAAYFVHWTLGHVEEHGANFDLILGPFDEGSTADDRGAVSLAYRLIDQVPTYMVIDAASRPTDDGTLASYAYARSEIIGDPIAGDIFAICDAILPNDPRLAELRGEAPKPPWATGPHNVSPGGSGGRSPPAPSRGRSSRWRAPWRRSR